MARNYEDQSSIRRYLLNPATGELHLRIEQRLLTEDDFFEELEIAEDELIDEYLAGTLSEDERKGFKENFLSTPERQQKLRFSRGLSRYVKTAETLEQARAPSWSHFLSDNRAYAVATAAMLVIVIGAVWFYRTPSLTNLATVTLTISHQTRGDASPATKVTLPRNVDGWRLHLKLPEAGKPATRYRVELLTQKGETLKLPTVGQDEQSVIVEIPASQLSPGQHALNLYLVNPDSAEQRIPGSYYFTTE